MAEEGAYSGRLRKRKLSATRTNAGWQSLTERSLAGMSMFSTRNGLYERARKKFKIQDGIKLFSFPFFKQRKEEVQAFFAQIYSEAKASVAALGHHALVVINQLKRLQRHYTMNIDGLAEVVGMDTWHWEFNPNGITVEMHGNIRQLVCPECHAVQELTRVAINTLKSKKAIPCTNCGQQDLRFKVMLYDDDEGDCITPEHVWDILEQDLQVTDMIVWVGISFEQSASTEYFRRVRSMLQSSGRLRDVAQVVINPSEEAVFNLMSACSNTNDLQVMDVRATADEAMPALAERLSSRGPALEPAPGAATGGMGATTASALNAHAAQAMAPSVQGSGSRDDPAEESAALPAGEPGAVHSC